MLDVQGKVERRAGHKLDGHRSEHLKIGDAPDRHRVGVD